jgi:hypothetical protein
MMANISCTVFGALPQLHDLYVTYQTQTEGHMRFISTRDLCATAQSSVANISEHTSYIMQQIKVFVHLIFRLMEENMS